MPSKSTGFSLIELLIATAIIFMILPSVSGLFIKTIKHPFRLSQELAKLTELRFIESVIRHDLVFLSSINALNINSLVATRRDGKTLRYDLTDKGLRRKIGNSPGSYLNAFIQITSFEPTLDTVLSIVLSSVDGQDTLFAIPINLSKTQ